MSEDFFRPGTLGHEKQNIFPENESRGRLKIESSQLKFEGDGGKIFEAKVSGRETGGRYRLSIKGREVVVKGEVDLPVGKTVNVRLTETDGGLEFELLGEKRPAKNDVFNRLFELLGRSDNTALRETVSDWLAENPDGGAKKFLADMNMEAGLLSGRDLKKLDSFLAVLKSAGPGQSEPVAANFIQDFLSGFKIPYSPRFARLLKAVFDLGQVPDRSLLKKLSASIALLENENGEIDKKRLKTFLLFEKNDFPINKSILGKVNIFPESSKVSALWQRLEQLPRWLFQGDGEQLKQLIENMGFDLEHRLLNGDRKALQTARFLLESLAGGSDGPQDGGEGEAAGLLFKNALASMADDKTIYLIIPYREGGETNFARVRFKDRRERKKESKEKTWSVDLELNLSQLGYLRVRALKNGDKLKIQISASDRNSVQLLKSGRRRLAGQLQEFGYRTSIEFKKVPDNSAEDFIENDLLPVDITAAGHINLRA
ncbi:MAG: flagellar hook-length control protein FliK [bacterium]